MSEFSFYYYSKLQFPDVQRQTSQTEIRKEGKVLTVVQWNWGAMTSTSQAVKLPEMIKGGMRESEASSESWRLLFTDTSSDQSVRKGTRKEGEEQKAYLFSSKQMLERLRTVPGSLAINLPTICRSTKRIWLACHWAKIRVKGNSHCICWQTLGLNRSLLLKYEQMENINMGTLKKACHRIKGKKFCIANTFGNYYRKVRRYNFGILFGILTVILKTRNKLGLPKTSSPKALQS